jgi:hypothetical protein
MEATDKQELNAIKIMLTASTKLSKNVFKCWTQHICIHAGWRTTGTHLYNQIMMINILRVIDTTAFTLHKQTCPNLRQVDIKASINKGQ